LDESVGVRKLLFEGWGVSCVGQIVQTQLDFVCTCHCLGRVFKFWYAASEFRAVFETGQKFLWDRETKKGKGGHISDVGEFSNFVMQLQSFGQFLKRGRNFFGTGRQKKEREVTSPMCGIKTDKVIVH